MLDYDGKRSPWPGTLTIVILSVLVVPVGLSAAILLCILTDFGVGHTVDDIRLNPGMFANQYAAGVVLAGWAAITGLVVLGIIGGVAFLRRCVRKPTRSQTPMPGPADQCGG